MLRVSDVLVIQTQRKVSREAQGRPGSRRSLPLCLWLTASQEGGSLTAFTSVSTRSLTRGMPNSADVFAGAVEGAVEGFILRALVLTEASATPLS